MERRDQVLIGRLLLPAVSTFFIRWWSTNGPFFSERAMAYHLLRSRTMNCWVRLFLRVLEPLVGTPHGVTGCGLPWPALASPPPCGWSTGFMAAPRTVGLMPRQRLAPALPSFSRLCSSLPTPPMVARHSDGTLRISPERRRSIA